MGSENVFVTARYFFFIWLSQCKCIWQNNTSERADKRRKWNLNDANYCIIRSLHRTMDWLWSKYLKRSSFHKHNCLNGLLSNSWAIMRLPKCFKSLISIKTTFSYHFTWNIISCVHSTPALIRAKSMNNMVANATSSIKWTEVSWVKFNLAGIFCCRCNILFYAFYSGYYQRKHTIQWDPFTGEKITVGVICLGSLEYNACIITMLQLP